MLNLVFYMRNVTQVRVFENRALRRIFLTEGEEVRVER
jgi:hypothetical protein